MAPRANWKGYLKLSLVSCAVELYPSSTTKDRVTFNMVNRETGNRLRRQLVDEVTGDLVESDQQVKGYEIAKRDYVILEDDEIESVAIESTHTIDIESFVPRAEIDEVYLETPYYLTPDGKVAEEAFAVIRDAMRERKVVGLGRVVLYRRERIVMLEPRGKGIAARTLRYGYEVQKATRTPAKGNPARPVLRENRDAILRHFVGVPPSGGLRAPGPPEGGTPTHRKNRCLTRLRLFHSAGRCPLLPAVGPSWKPWGLRQTWSGAEP